MIGTNNIGYRKDTPEQTLAGIRSNLRTIKHQMPDAKILLLSIFPRGDGANDPVRIANAEVSAHFPALAVADPAVFHLDINQAFLDDQGNIPRELMPDLLHPNTGGYKVWAAAMEPTLSALLNDEPVQ